MNTSRSDAFVFFGAIGDLAYKKIFPALQALIKRGNLNVPIIGVARANNHLTSDCWETRYAVTTRYLLPTPVWKLHGAW